MIWVSSFYIGGQSPAGPLKCPGFFGIRTSVRTQALVHRKNAYRDFTLRWNNSRFSFLHNSQSLFVERGDTEKQTFLKTGTCTVDLFRSVCMRTHQHYVKLKNLRFNFSGWSWGASLSATGRYLSLPKTANTIQPTKASKIKVFMVIDSRDR